MCFREEGRSKTSGAQAHPASSLDCVVGIKASVCTCVCVCLLFHLRTDSSSVSQDISLKGRPLTSHPISPAIRGSWWVYSKQMKQQVVRVF